MARGCSCCRHSPSGLQGNNLRSGDFLSPYLQAARLESITAIVAGKLLRIPAKDVGVRSPKL
jgi:hypothetical protein